MPLQVRWIAVRVFFPAVFLLAFALPGRAQDLAAREQQLRQRVDELYQLLVTGEWRKAEQYVTEDTRDLWYAQPKSTIMSFALGEIKMDPDGSRADVIVKATFRVLRVPQPVTMPQRSEWFFQGDQWFFKVKKPETLLDVLKATKAASSPVAAKSPLVFTPNPIRIPDPESGSESVKVTFWNMSSEVVSFQDLSANCSCLTVEVSRTALPPRGRATLTVTYHPSTPPPSEPAPAVEAILTPSMHILNIPVLIQPREGQ